MHSNYTIFSTKERNGKEKRWQKKQYLGVGDYLHVVISAENIPLFFRNLIAEIDKKKARFHKIDLNLDSPESS